MKHKMTKACSISPAVKAAVYERDNRRCILCDSNRGQPVAHYIARSHGGLGIEQNIFTACDDCHRCYDNSDERPILRGRVRAYLESRYSEWDEAKLIYKKGMKL